MTRLAVGFQSSAALPAALPGSRRAEVQQGSAPTSVPVLSAAARALGDCCSGSSAGHTVSGGQPALPPLRSSSVLCLHRCGKPEKEPALRFGFG